MTGEIVRLIITSTVSFLIALGTLAITAYKEFRINKDRNDIERKNAIDKMNLEKELKQMEVDLSESRIASENRIKEMDIQHQTQIEILKQNIQNKADMVVYQRNCMEDFLSAYSSLYQFSGTRELTSETYRKMSTARGQMIMTSNKLLTVFPSDSIICAMTLRLLSKLRNPENFPHNIIKDDFVTQISQNVIEISSEALRLIYKETDHPIDNRP